MNICIPLLNRNICLYLCYSSQFPNLILLWSKQLLATIARYMPHPYLHATFSSDALLQVILIDHGRIIYSWLQAIDEGLLLKLPFTTIFEYLQVLKPISYHYQSMFPILVVMRIASVSRINCCRQLMICWLEYSSRIQHSLRWEEGNLGKLLWFKVVSVIIC